MRASISTCAMRRLDGALHVAAEQGMLRMVNYLLARGADANVCTAKGRTPYDVAAGYSRYRTR